MPNWCYNGIEIVGPKPQVQEMFDKIIEANSFLDGLLPLPFKWDWHKAIEYWGTKWADDVGAMSEDVIDEKNGLHSFNLQIETAWAPPILALQKISSNYKGSAFGLAYYEPGMAFAGRIVFLNGICVSEWEGEIPEFTDYDEDPEQYHEDESDFQMNLRDQMEQDLYRAAQHRKARIII